MQLEWKVGVPRVLIALVYATDPVHQFDKMLLAGFFCQSRFGCSAFVISPNVIGAFRTSSVPFTARAIRLSSQIAVGKVIRVSGPSWSSTGLSTAFRSNSAVGIETSLNDL